MPTDGWKPAGASSWTSWARAQSFPGVLVDAHSRKLLELQQSALLSLGNRLRQLTDPVDFILAAARIAAETLGCSRAGYGRVDPVAEVVDVGSDYVGPQVHVSLAGRHRFRDYGVYIKDLLSAKVAINDLAVDARTTAGKDRLA